MNRMRVLLVDDEPASLNALSALLGHQHDVVTCAGGAEALARLEQSAYDLLMTDLSMPQPDVSTCCASPRPSLRACRWWW